MGRICIGRQMMEKTFQVEGMAGAGKEAEVRTCKVCMWRAVWAVVGLHLTTGVERVGLGWLCCRGENRKGFLQLL